MSDSRPPDWDWVSATGNCSAPTMLNTLLALAKRDTKTRNAQLKRDRFKVDEIDGLQFSVHDDGGWDDRVFVRVEHDLKTITVMKGAKDPHPAAYTVGLDINGNCKFRSGDTELDAWQVTKAALEQMLFS